MYTIYLKMWPNIECNTPMRYSKIHQVHNIFFIRFICIIYSIIGCNTQHTHSFAQCILYTTVVWLFSVYLSFYVFQLVVRGTRCELLLHFNVVDVCPSVGVSSSLILFPNEMRSLFTILYLLLCSILYISLSISVFVCFGLYTKYIEHSRFACARALKCNVI